MGKREKEKRLTVKDDCGNWQLKGVAWKELHKGKVITEELNEKLYGALSKLKDYEDTGLSPENLYSIDEAYTQQAWELGKLEKELIRYKVALFIAVKNKLVAPVGIRKGKSEEEIDKMTAETIKEFLQMIDSADTIEDYIKRREAAVHQMTQEEREKLWEG